MTNLYPHSIKEAVDQIDSCSFECEGGPLEKNVAWEWIKAALKVGPEYWPGQQVYYQEEAKTPTGEVLKAWKAFYIVGMYLDSSATERFWLYSLSDDPPQPYHYGKTKYRSVKASDLRLTGGQHDQ